MHKPRRLHLRPRNNDKYLRNIHEQPHHNQQQWANGYRLPPEPNHMAYLPDVSHRSRLLHLQCHDPNLILLLGRDRE
jgi:hypothetical protein